MTTNANEIVAELNVTGAAFDADALTHRTQLQPSKKWRGGDPIGRRSRLHECNGWSIAAPKKLEVEDAVEDLLLLLQPHWTELVVATCEQEVELSIVVYARSFVLAISVRINFSGLLSLRPASTLTCTISLKKMTNSLNTAATYSPDAVVGVADQPNVYYFGSAGGGVWKTTDGAQTWKPVSDGFFGGTIGAVAVAPSDPSVVYAGSGEEAIRGNVSPGGGCGSRPMRARAGRTSGSMTRSRSRASAFIRWFQCA